MGQHIDGDDPGKAPSGQGRQETRSAVTEVQWTTREAMRTPTMWMLMGGLSVHAMAVSGVQIHLISHLQDRGMTALVAALSYTIGGSVMTLTGYFWGHIADRFQTRYVYAMAALIFIVYQSAIMAATNIWWVILIGISQGLGFGGYLLVTRTIFANYYGRRSAGAIQGIATPVQVLVGGAGALVAGAIFDATGTYMVAFGTFLGLLVLAVIIILLAPRPVKKTITEADAQGLKV